MTFCTAFRHGSSWAVAYVAGRPSTSTSTQGCRVSTSSSL
jgi:hypothetical protein